MRVLTRSVGICGSDLHALAGAHPFISLPVVPGQEVAGIGGTVMVLGVAERDVTIPLPIVQDREIRLSGSAMYVREDVLGAMRLIADGAVPEHELVTHRFPLASAAEAFRRASSGDEVKVHPVVGPI